MESKDIRARIVELENAQSSRGQATDDPRRANQSGSGEDDSWPWAFLFEGSLKSPENSGPESFAWDQWLGEGLRGLQRFLRSMGPEEEFWLHMRAAERELLLACRVLIESRLRHLEQQGNEESTRSAGLEQIEVEF
jgi:hypothetical protein